jgi:hypothetical protein
MSASRPRPEPFTFRTDAVATTYVGPDCPRREHAQAFIRDVFARHYGASVSAFAPNLLLLEMGERITAAVGWRAASSGPLFLERYFDAPIEAAMAERAAQPVRRSRIAEVCNLAADKPGSSPRVIHALASLLDRLGYEWVVFTATQELVRIFTRLGLPLLALAPADPARLGEAAREWGCYYDTQPVVVAGKIRLGLERAGRHA